MLIEFLGHAGYWVKANGLEILFDPWLIPSSFEHPILHSVVPGLKTIDYLIPEPVRRVDEINPDYILMSHYHTHHSPKTEIEFWLSRSKKKVTLIGPTLQKSKNSEFLENFKERFPQHNFKMSDSDFFITHENLKISMLTHAMDRHLAYFVEADHKSFLHIADASVSKLWYDRRLDPVWLKFRHLNPDYMALTVAGISSRESRESGERYIRENGFLGPVEAANLVRLINPKNVSVMGIFNFSIWKNRTEYGYPFAEVENYFSWAINHLAPHIGVQIARPGYQFEIGEDDFSMRVYRPKNQPPGQPKD